MSFSDCIKSFLFSLAPKQGFSTIAFTLATSRNPSSLFSPYCCSSKGSNFGCPYFNWSFLYWTANLLLAEICDIRVHSQGVVQISLQRFWMPHQRAAKPLWPSACLFTVFTAQAWSLQLTLTNEDLEIFISTCGPGKPCGCVSWTCSHDRAWNLKKTLPARGCWKAASTRAFWKAATALQGWFFQSHERKLPSKALVRAKHSATQQSFAATGFGKRFSNNSSSLKYAHKHMELLHLFFCTGCREKAPTFHELYCGKDVVFCLKDFPIAACYLGCGRGSEWKQKTFPWGLVCAQEPASHRSCFSVVMPVCGVWNWPRCLRAPIYGAEDNPGLLPGSRGDREVLALHICWA